MATMKFYTVKTPPTLASEDGTYYVKFGRLSQIWVKIGTKIELMAEYDIDSSGGWYGIRKYKGDDSKRPTRIGNPQMHLDLPLQSQIYRYIATLDGNKIPLNPDNSIYDMSGNRVALDGTLGNIMLHVPNPYFRCVDTPQYTDYCISPFPLPGFKLIEIPDISAVHSTYDNINNRAASVCSLVFDDFGDIIRGEDGFPLRTENAAQFRGGSNNATLDGTKASSLGMCRTYASGSDIVNKCKAVGAGYHNNSGLAYSVLALYYYIEYANFDIQEAYNPVPDVMGYRQGGLGNGTAVISSEWSEFNSYYPFIPSLVTAKLGNKTGIVPYVIKEWQTGVDKTVQVPSYRGFEMPSEYINILSSDFAVWHQTEEQGGKSLCFHCPDIDKIIIPSADQTNIPDGYELVAEVPRNDGYIREVSNNIYMMPTVSTGGGGNKAFCDYYYQPTGGASPTFGWFSTRRGGYAHSGAIAGWRYTITSSRFSGAGANHGFRLCRSKR